jgi:ribonuclease HI
MTSKLSGIQIYTDGACSGNPGPGGWAAVLLFGEHEKELSGFVPDTTNNRMELLAAIKGLQALKQPCVVDLYSDSAYLVSAFNEGWLENWQRKNWKNAAKQPVANVDLWKQLLDLSNRHEVTWHKVKGHSDNAYNNRCDELAVAAIEQGQAKAKANFATGDLQEKILSDELLYAGRILDLHRYSVSLVNNDLSTREVVRHSGGAAIVALTDEQEVIMVTQFRLAIGNVLLELPAGKLEKDEDPLLCAQRELSEETGYQAKNWNKLGAVYPTPGYSDELIHIFLARDLHAGKQHPDDDEFLRVQKLKLTEIDSYLESGDVLDAKTVLGLTLAQRYMTEEVR